MPTCPRPAPWRPQRRRYVEPGGASLMPPARAVGPGAARATVASIRRQPARGSDRPAGRRCARCRSTGARCPRRRRPCSSSSGDSWRCVVEAGCVASERTSPMLTSRVNSCSASRKRAPRSRPWPARPLSPKVEHAGGLARKVLLHQRVVRVVLQAGVVDPARPSGAACRWRATVKRVVADAIHAQRQGLDALQDQEGVERRDRRAGVAQRHDARAADVGGRPERLGVDDAVVADVGLVEPAKALPCARPRETCRNRRSRRRCWCRARPRYLVSECTTMSAPCSNGRHR